MAYTYKKGDVVVVKASRYTKAKKGYLVFWGEYPSMGKKYFISKGDAIKYARKKVKRRKVGTPLSDITRVVTGGVKVGVTLGLGKAIMGAFD